MQQSKYNKKYVTLTRDIWIIIIMLFNNHEGTIWENKNVKDKSIKKLMRLIYLYRLLIMLIPIYSKLNLHIPYEALFCDLIICAITETYYAILISFSHLLWYQSIFSYSHLEYLYGVGITSKTDMTGDILINFS